MPARPSTASILERLAREKGLPVEAVSVLPRVDAMKLRPVRVGLWDQYGGSMPSGWTRWLLEQFEFPFEVIYPRTLDAGDLTSRFDVLIFVDGGIPLQDRGRANQPRAEEIPEEHRDRLGAVTVATTVPQLRRFVEAGGTLLTIGSSTAVAVHFGLPVSDALVEGGVPLPSQKFYIPGSLLEAKVDTTHPLAYGVAQRVHVFFDESRAFRTAPEAHARGVKTVAWFDTPTPLRSGWAWGQKYLDQAAAILEAPVGKGRVVLFGPEVAWRAQPHGTFKFLFNGIYYGAAQP